MRRPPRQKRVGRSAASEVCKGQAGKKVVRTRRYRKDIRERLANIEGRLTNIEARLEELLRLWAEWY